MTTPGERGKARIETVVVWRKWPEDPPPKLPQGHYERFLVYTGKSMYGRDMVQECSWLFEQWHLRHDGCSEVTNMVQWWCELPKPPVPEEEERVEIDGHGNICKRRMSTAPEREEAV
jgi:hypothetical protein